MRLGEEKGECTESSSGARRTPDPFPRPVIQGPWEKTQPDLRGCRENCFLRGQSGFC